MTVDDGLVVPGGIVTGGREEKGAKVDVATGMGVSGVIGAEVVGLGATGAEVVGARVTGAEVVGARVTGAEVVGAIVTGAAVTGAGVTGATGPRVVGRVGVAAMGAIVGAGSSPVN